MVPAPAPAPPQSRPSPARHPLLEPQAQRQDPRSVAEPKLDGQRAITTRARGRAPSTAAKRSGSVRMHLVGFILLVGWKAPPVVVVAVSALGGAALALF